MTKTTLVKPLSVAIGAAFVASLAGTTVASAADNPFGMSQLSSGYMVAEEGKCGGNKATTQETKPEGKCGATKKTAKEGKCGEGKCGAKREAHEGKCGGEKKPAEGKCGGSK